MDKEQWYSQCLALLESTPHAIVKLVVDLPPALLQATDGPGTWNPRQVLEHLVWGEVDDWIPRVRLILEQQDRVAFTPFDREGGAKRYGDWSVIGYLNYTDGLENELRADTQVWGGLGIGFKY